VNEASTIIQNAAHEDANIIFGAVQDETMGDEVKITVIATGFKQQEMPQRRERMLAESTLPTMRYDVPIAPRVSTTRSAAPKFASEAVPEPTAAPAAPLVETKEPASVVEASAAEIRPAQELVPVPASVFDDDFFKASPAGGDAVETGLPERFREPAHAAMVSRVQHDDAWRATAELHVADPLVRAPSFGNAMAVPADHAEPDELDIPAFLRRSN
jgi:cell division protein FtsZ